MNDKAAFTRRAVNTAASLYPPPVPRGGGGEHQVCKRICASCSPNLHLTLFCKAHLGFIPWWQQNANRHLPAGWPCVRVSARPHRGKKRTFALTLWPAVLDLQNGSSFLLRTGVCSVFDFVFLRLKLSDEKKNVTGHGHWNINIIKICAQHHAHMLYMSDSATGFSYSFRALWATFPHFSHLWLFSFIFLSDLFALLWWHFTDTDIHKIFFLQVTTILGLNERWDGLICITVYLHEIKIRKEALLYRWCGISLFRFWLTTDLLLTQPALKRMATTNTQHCGNFFRCHICQSQSSKDKGRQKDTAAGCVAVTTLNWFFLTGEEKNNTVAGSWRLALHYSNVVTVQNK